MALPVQTSSSGEKQPPNWRPVHPFHPERLLALQLVVKDHAPKRRTAPFKSPRCYNEISR